MNLEKEIIKLIEKKGKVTFNELLNHFNNKEEIIKALNKLEENEKIAIETYLPKQTSFIEYLKDLSYTLWFYLTILVVILVNLFVFVIPNVYPYNIFRWIFSAIFIAYLPGFTIIEALFPSRSELEALERFGFHIGTSIGVVPLLGLLLNYSPWLLRLEPIMFTLTIFILIFAITCLIVKYKVYKNIYEK
jgi:uncharacterized membrane protein